MAPEDWGVVWLGMRLVEADCTRLVHTDLKALRIKPGLDFGEDGLEFGSRYGWGGGSGDNGNVVRQDSTVHLVLD
jgi:hypothetical protein